MSVVWDLKVYWWACSLFLLLSTHTLLPFSKVLPIFIRTTIVRAGTNMARGPVSLLLLVVALTTVVLVNMRESSFHRGKTYTWRKVGTLNGHQYLKVLSYCHSVAISELTALIIWGRARKYRFYGGWRCNFFTGRQQQQLPTPNNPEREIIDKIQYNIFSFSFFPLHLISWQGMHIHILLAIINSHSLLLQSSAEECRRKTLPGVAMLHFALHANFHSTSFQLSKSHLQEKTSISTLNPFCWSVLAQPSFPCSFF